MTNATSVAAPNEALALLRTMKCPACSSPLEEGNQCLKFGSSANVDYLYIATCAKNSTDYIVDLVWNDPQKIWIDREAIEFEHQGQLYVLTKIHAINKFDSTLIEIRDLHEEGSKPITMTLDEDIFNFKDYNVQKFVNRINIVKTFK